jgi:hypothetical protein
MPQAVKTATGVIIVNCKKGWNKCQKQQACSKIRRMDSRAKNSPTGMLENIAKTNPAGYPDIRTAGNTHAAAYDGTNLAHPCMAVTQGRAANQGRPMQADHIHELQFGGAAEGPFMWLDASVNGSIGKSLNNNKITHPTGFKAGKSCAPEC